MADLPKCPRGRTEEYLSDIAGLTNTAPDKPWSRKEAYLNEINKHVEGMEGDIADLNQKVAALATDFSYKGSVADYAHLPSDAAVGDVYTTEDEGYMYVWDGTQWQILNMTGAGALTGDSDPTTATEGTLGQLYLNTTSGKLFYCSATGSTYTWVSLDSPIQSISVNGTAVTPDENKNVALTIPDGVKTLTTADYNYPTTGAATGIAAWELGKGVYRAGSNNLRLYYAPSTGAAYREELPSSTIFVISAAKGTFTALIYPRIGYGAAGSDAGITWKFARLSSSTLNAGDAGFLLSNKNIIDNLTSTSVNDTLSANQGKVLKDLIDSLVIKNAGAPTTSTVGTVGMLYEDTTNGKLYQLTAIDTTDPQNPSYTWSEVGGSSVNVVQTTGNSTTDVMSQNAVTGMVYKDPAAKRKIQIGNNAAAYESGSIAIGSSANASVSSAFNTIAIGASSRSSGGASVSVGNGAGSDMNGQYKQAKDATFIGAFARNNSLNNADGAIALGAYSQVSQPGEMNIGSTDTSCGYNSSNYRLITGLYDGQSAHDAATKGQLDTAIINGGTTAPTTSTAGAVGTQYTYVDTTGTPTAHLCVCTEIDNTDPSNPIYTWSTLI